MQTIIIIVILVGLLDICLIASNAPAKYDFLWLLPAAFVSLSVVFNQIYKVLGKSIVASLLWSLMLLKNIIIPFCIAMGNGHYKAIVDTSEHLFTAYFIEIYELFVIFFCIYQFARSVKQQDVYAGAVIINKNAVNLLFRCMLCLLLVYIIIIIEYPQLFLKNYLVVSNYSEEEQIAHVNFSRQVRENVPKIPYYLHEVLFDCLRWLLPLSFMLKIYTSKYVKDVSSIFLAFMFIIFSSIFLATDERAVSVYIMLPFILMLGKLYPLYRKKLLSLLYIIPIIGIFGLFMKSYNSDNILYLDIQDISNTLQAYFSGPDNVAVALMMPFPTFEVFCGDIFKWIPFISYFFLDINSSTILFNRIFFQEVGITTQIIPMMSQGTYYFSILGAPIFTYLFCRLAFRLERKAVIAKSGLTYCYNIMFCSFIPFAIVMYNASIFLMLYFSIFFPTMLLIKYCLKKYK